MDTATRQAWFPVTVPYRPIAVLGVLVLSAYLGWNASSLDFRGIPGSPLIIGGILLAMFLAMALRRLELGVLALVMAAFFVKFSIPTGTQTNIPVSAVLVALMVAVWIVWMLVRRQVALFPSRVNRPLLGFILVGLVSLPWGWLYWRPDLFGWRASTFPLTRTSGMSFQVVQLGGLALTLLLPAAFLLALNIFRDIKWAKRLFAIVALVSAPILLQNWLGIGLDLSLLGVNGSGLVSNWVVALPYAQLLFNNHLKTWQRRAMGILVVGWLVYSLTVNITWISGWGPAVAALLVITFFKSKKALLIMLLLTGVAVLIGWDYFYHKVWLESQATDFNRFWIWETIISLTLRHASPLLGTGPAGYFPFFQTYYQRAAISSHNNYVDIFAETGILGTLFFIWFLFSLFQTGWSQRTKLRDPFALAFNNGVLGALVGLWVGMLLGDWVIPFVYNVGFSGFNQALYGWVLLGTMAGLERLVSPDAERQEGVEVSQAASAISAVGAE